MFLSAVVRLKIEIINVYRFSSLFFSLSLYLFCGCEAISFSFLSLGGRLRILIDGCGNELLLLFCMLDMNGIELEFELAVLLFIYLKENEN